MTGVSRWWSAAVILAVPVLLVARLALGGFGFDTVWAEDGRVFLLDARQHGLASLTYTYAGYLHLLPRVLVGVGAQLPTPAFALYAALASVSVVGLLVGFVFWASTLLLCSRAWALAPAFAMALVPAAGVEAIGNLANLQWWLLPAAFAGLAVAPVAIGRLRGAATAVRFVAAASSPLIVLALPAATLHGRRGLRTWPVYAVMAGLAVQIAAALAAPHSNLILHRDLGLRLRDGAGFFAGVLGSARPPKAVALVVGLLVAAGVWMLWRRARGGQRMAAVAAAVSVSLFMVTSVLSGTAGRCQAASALIGLFGVLALVRETPGVGRAALAVAIGPVLLGFPVAAERVSGAAWEPAATRVDDRCAAGDDGGLVEVAPQGWDGRRFTLPCR